MDTNPPNLTRTAGAPLPHDSALAHCTGQARFADDIPDIPGTLHAALILADTAHARLLALRTDEARAHPGVVAILTPADIPGSNDISPAHKPGEHLFAETEILHWGQPLGMVVATTRDAAIAAAKTVTAEVEKLPPVLSIEDALEAGDLLLPPMVMTTGDVDQALATAPRTLSGEFRCGGQEHFYLEGQICLAIPGEDGDLTLHSS
ncbi:molybdopterin cofactor-binding domain-containing protein, partial [Roseomonas mucosa]